MASARAPSRRVTTDKCQDHLKKSQVSHVGMPRNCKIC